MPRLFVMIGPMAWSGRATGAAPLHKNKATTNPINKQDATKTVIAGGFILTQGRRDEE
jgi:hypothetical protein